MLSSHEDEPILPPSTITEDASLLGQQLKASAQRYTKGEEKREKKWLALMNKDKDFLQAQACDATGVSLTTWLSSGDELVILSLQLAPAAKSLFRRPSPSFILESRLGDGPVVSTRRSYLEFLLLRRQLVSSFPGLCVPPVPRQSHGLFGANLLACFLHGVAGDEFLARERLFLAFLGHESGQTDDAPSRWLQAVVASKTPEDKVSETAATNFRLLHARLLHLSLALEAEQRSGTTLALSSLHTSDKFRAWKEKEASGGKDLLEFLDPMGNALERRAELLSAKQGMAAEVAYEALWLEEYLEMLKNSRGAVKRVAKASARLEKATSSGGILRAAKSALLVQQKARFQVNCLLGMELARFGKVRGERLLHLISLYSQQAEQSCRREVEEWERV